MRFRKLDTGILISTKTSRIQPEKIGVQRTPGFCEPYFSPAQFLFCASRITSRVIIKDPRKCGRVCIAMITPFTS